MNELLEERIAELKKKVAELEGRVPEQPEEKFVPEDSNGKHYENEIKTTC